MHAFTRGFGFRLHSNFCFLSKVATTGPFLHLHFCFFFLSVQSLLFSFLAPLSCEPTFVFFFFQSLGFGKIMHWMCRFWKKYGKVFIPTHAIWNFPKLLPLPSCKVFKTITVVKFSKLPLIPSCKVFKTSTSYIETFQNTILTKMLSLFDRVHCLLTVAS
jgi:hypothetical protein